MITQCTSCNCQSSCQGSCPRPNCSGILVETIQIETYKQSLHLMSVALHSLDEHVIGIAKIYNVNELIVKKDGDIFITFRVGALLGSQTNHYPVEKFKEYIFMFPNKMTLAELKKDPFALNEFCIKNKL